MTSHIAVQWNHRLKLKRHVLQITVVKDSEVLMVDMIFVEEGVAIPGTDSSGTTVKSTATDPILFMLGMGNTHQLSIAFYN